MNMFTRLALCIAAGATLMLAGCGKDGQNGQNGRDGADGKDASSAPVQASAFTADEWVSLAPTGEVLSVTINSPPVVKFKLADSTGKLISGLAAKDADGKLINNNISFTIAKLVPGTTGAGGTTAPSKWVNYIVTTLDASNKVTGGTRPTTDSTGTLVEDAANPGTYTYTFARDITKVKDDVAALTDSGNNKKADLGDLTYDKNLTHRLVIQVAGANKAAGVTDVIEDPLNLVYDFVPATGKAVTVGQREVVSTAACNQCHSKLNGLGFHGGSRNEVRFCVTCHTDQRKYGRANSASASGVFTGTTYVADGEVQGDFPVFIHKLHVARKLGNGSDATAKLTKSGYNYAGVIYSNTTYPRPIANCTTCHKGTDKNPAPQAGNYGAVPSRLACGSCHDGVTWADNSGTVRHTGGSASDDSTCALCHKTADIIRYHDNGDVGASGGNATLRSYDSVPAGVYTITYEAKSVGISSTGFPQMTFFVKKDGAVVDFGTYNASSNPELIPGTTGGPNVYWGVNTKLATPSSAADYNDGDTANTGHGGMWSNVTIKTLWSNGTLTKNADGSYTATGATAVPAGASMLTGILMGPFVQKTDAYPGGVTIAPVAAVGRFSGTYNNVQFAARRVSVDDAKCNNCHGRLMVKSSHVANSRGGMSVEACILCHFHSTNGGVTVAAPTRLSSNGSAMGHNIHANSMRSIPRATYNAAYPGVLKDCTQCHTADGYDYSSAAALKAANENRLLPVHISTDTSVVALPYAPQGITLPYNASVYANNIVNSPITHACSGCHDSSSAIAHMRQNGGTFYGTRTAALATAEACLTCHGPGKQYSIKKAHGK